MLHEGNSGCREGKLASYRVRRSEDIHCTLVQASIYGLYVMIRWFPYQTLMPTLGVESAGFPGQSEEEIERLLHMVRLSWGSAISC